MGCSSSKPRADRPYGYAGRPAPNARREPNMNNYATSNAAYYIGMGSSDTTAYTTTTHHGHHGGGYDGGGDCGGGGGDGGGGS